MENATHCDLCDWTFGCFNGSAPCRKYKDDSTEASAGNRSAANREVAQKLKVKVFPYRKDIAHGNIIWAERNLGDSYYRVSKFAMRNGKFPPNHPVGGGCGVGSECGDGQSIKNFRERGYWASCFPEGDGITWKPLKGQSDEQCLQDIRDAFGFDADWTE